MDFLLGIQAFSLDKILQQVNSGFLEEEEAHGHGHGGHEEDHGHAHGGHGDDCSGCDDPAHGGHGSHEGHGGHEAHGHAEACDKAACDHPAHSEPNKGRRKHVHDYRVTSVGIIRDQEVQQDKLDSFISWLIQKKGPDLYRSKGVLAVKGVKEKFIFHAVHMQFSGKPQDLWNEGEKRCCKMVFIGKNLDRAELNEKFDECLVK